MILAEEILSDPKAILETETGVGHASVLIAEEFSDSRLVAVERDALHRWIPQKMFADEPSWLTGSPSCRRYKRASIERSDLVFVDGLVVDPDRLLQRLPVDRLHHEAGPSVALRSLPCYSR